MVYSEEQTVEDVIVFITFRAGSSASRYSEAMIDVVGLRPGLPCMSGISGIQSSTLSLIPHKLVPSCCIGV